MNPWILDDGTKVYLGGNVEGDTELARWVRVELRVAKTEMVNSHFGPSPHEEVLDVSVPHLLDAFLRFTWTVVSAPGFETPASEPRPDPPDGCVY